MTVPSWVTGYNLGSKPSGSVDLITITASNDTQKIILLDNSIPCGFSSLANTATLSLTGTAVTNNTNYQISLRAINQYGITDQNFTLTLTTVNNDPWAGVSGSLYNWELGRQNELQISAVWINPLEYVISQGSLPMGVYLDPQGILYGIPGSDLVAVSLDATTWQIRSPANLNTTGSYTFTVRARDTLNKGFYFDKIFTLSTVKPTTTLPIVLLMTANSNESLTRQLLASGSDTVSSNQINTDSSFFPNFVVPYSASLGNYRHNNVFIKQIKTWDPLGTLIEYGLVDTAPGDPPPSFLKIDRFNGYLSGQLPDINFVNQTYNVTVQMTRMIAAVPVVQLITFTLTVEGISGNKVEFLDPENNVLASSQIYSYALVQGEDSTLAVQAQWSSNPNQLLYFDLAGGSLPPGISLSARGLLVGRISWQARLGEYSFTVGAYDPTLRTPDLAPLNLQRQNFSIVVNPKIFDRTRVSRSYDAYYRAFLPNDQRRVWKNLVSDSILFGENIIFRPEDTNYGRHMDCEFLAFPALKEYDMEKFVTTVSQNWTAKRFRFGAFQTAKVLDQLGAYIADVVYVSIKDNLTNAKGLSPGQQLTNPITGDQLHPSTLINQLDRMIADPGVVSDSMLPQWMTSVQDDGRPVGFIPAAVLCYLTPGNGVKTVKKIKTLGISLNTLDFHVDRILIKQVPTNSAPTSFDTASTMIDGDQTTFDIDNLGDKYIYFNTDGAIYDIIN